MHCQLIFLSIIIIMIVISQYYTARARIRLSPSLQRHFYGHRYLSVGKTHFVLSLVPLLLNSFHLFFHNRPQRRYQFLVFPALRFSPRQTTTKLFYSSSVQWDIAIQIRGLYCVNNYRIILVLRHQYCLHMWISLSKILFYRTTAIRHFNTSASWRRSPVLIHVLPHEK